MSKRCPCSVAQPARVRLPSVSRASGARGWSVGLCARGFLGPHFHKHCPVLEPVLADPPKRATEALSWGCQLSGLGGAPGTLWVETREAALPRAPP